MISFHVYKGLAGCTCLAIFNSFSSREPLLLPYNTGFLPQAHPAQAGFWLAYAGGFMPRSIGGENLPKWPGKDEIKQKNPSR
jgi:hypothetical protein